MAGESVKSLECPNCGGTVELRLPGQSMSVVCKSCGTILDPTKSEGAAIIEKAAAKMTIKPLIPLGQKGDLVGKKWMCVGLVVREDVKWKFDWHEYLLFNPLDGFRWLTMSDDHWAFVEPMQQKPVDAFDTGMYFNGHPSLLFQGRMFRLYQQGRAEVKYCLGEFYWKIHKGDRVDYADYVRSGEDISRENDAQELIYSHSVYVDVGTVESAFGITGLNRPWKPFPFEPYGWEESWNDVATYWKYFILGSVVVFGLSLLTSSSKLVSTGSYPTQAFDFGGNAAVRPPKIEDIDLGSTQNLEFDLYSPVSNNWFEVGITLVNKSTGDSVDFDEGVEYYSGYDSDGSWTEGSTSTSKVLSAIPAGSYELYAQPATNASIPASSYELKVIRNVPLYSNFILCLLLLSIFPLCVYFLNYFETVARWKESDFSPFGGGDDGDDSS